jgi:hypothetical protein
MTGPWNNVQNQYLGVSFKVGTETHYGWIRMSVSDPVGPMKVLITGYACETVPNKSLRAGQTFGDGNDPLPEATQTPPLAPSTLGMLALGSWKSATRLSGQIRSPRLFSTMTSIDKEMTNDFE